MKEKDWREKIARIVNIRPISIRDANELTEEAIFIIQKEIDRAREEEREHLSRRLVVGIKTLKEKYIDDTEISHGKIDDFIVNEIGGELKEYYKGGWGWYS